MILQLEKNIGYHFSDKKNISDALTLAHKGKSASYERLEFLGDRVLGLFVADTLLKQYPKDKEGDIAKRFTALVKEDTLALLARKINLSDFLITNENELRQNNSILADVLEAVTACVYLDGGMSAVYQTLFPLFSELIDGFSAPPQESKTTLQEWAHKKKLPLPVYEVISKSGPEHAPDFVISVSIEGYPPVEGRGHSKRLAEQDAATSFLKEYTNAKK